MNLTVNTLNMGDMSSLKLGPFFTTGNFLFLKHFISFNMFLKIRIGQ